MVPMKEPVAQESLPPPPPFLSTQLPEPAAAAFSPPGMGWDALEGLVQQSAEQTTSREGGRSGLEASSQTQAPCDRHRAERGLPGRSQEVRALGPSPRAL